MKKLANLSIIYFILAMAGGVFYREFTKFNDFTGQTALSVVHTHLMVLGTIVFLIVLLMAKNFPLLEEKLFKPFMIIYNIALTLMAVTLLVRGVFQVRGTLLSTAVDASISGIAGITHVALFVSLLMLLLAIKNSVSKNN